LVVLFLQNCLNQNLSNFKRPFEEKQTSMKKLFLILYVLFILRGLYQLFEDHSWTLSFFTIVFGALGIVALLNNVQEKVSKWNSNNFITCFYDVPLIKF
jgi:hypothetical protein